jgi:competence protein ComEA
MMTIRKQLFLTYFIGLVFCLSFAGYSAFAADSNVFPKVKAVKVDLNAARAEELSRLPGIGVKKAEAIVAYRKENGPFHSEAELLKVKGIGEKLLDKIKPMITVEAKGIDMPGAIKK